MRRRSGKKRVSRRQYQILKTMEKYGLELRHYLKERRWAIGKPGEDREKHIYSVQARKIVGQLRLSNELSTDEVEYWVLRTYPGQDPLAHISKSEFSKEPKMLRRSEPNVAGTGPKPPSWYDENGPKARAMKGSGAKQSEIADAIGCSVPTVRRLLERSDS